MAASFAYCQHPGALVALVCQPTVPHQLLPRPPRTQLGKRFTIIFVDLSGNRPIGDVSDIIEKYGKVFAPKLFVVKSFNLKRLVGQCCVFPEGVHDTLWRHQDTKAITDLPASHPIDCCCT